MFQDRIQAFQRNGQGNKVAILVLDPDYRRRAAIASALDPGTHFVLPLETMQELADHPSLPDCVLLADEHDNVINVSRYYARFGVIPPIIAYAVDVVPQRVVRSVREGAAGYLAYPFSEDDFDKAFKELSEARREQDGDGGGGVRGGTDWSDSSVAARLTRRETEVLRLVSNGSSNQQIADLLKISRRTVEVHRYNILAKLNARNSIEASNIARKLRLI